MYKGTPITGWEIDAQTLMKFKFVLFVFVLILTLLASLTSSSKIVWNLSNATNIIFPFLLILFIKKYKS